MKRSYVQIPDADPSLSRTFSLAIHYSYSRRRISKHCLMILFNFCGTVLFLKLFFFLILYRLITLCHLQTLFNDFI